MNCPTCKQAIEKPDDHTKVKPAGPDEDLSVLELRLTCPKCGAEHCTFIEIEETEFLPLRA